MSTASPDAAWSDPTFIARRVLRKPTAPLSAYAPVALDAAARDRLSAAARDARSENGPPAAFVFGVMPRSGTNYLESMLLTHPDVAGAPNGLRELPAFPAADDIRGFEGALTRFYGPNADVFVAYEWFAYAIAGYLNAARTRVRETASLLVLKDPHIRRITLFDAVLAAEKAMIVLRDGRYLVDSTLRTWPLRTLGRTFEDICVEWDAATRAALDYEETAPSDRIRLVRYEDLVADTPGRMAEICDWLGLDSARLSVEALTSSPILGSSTHSKGQDGAVGWTPVARGAAFDPTGRPLDWSDRQKQIFERTCGETQRRAGYDL